MISNQCVAVSVDAKQPTVLIDQLTNEIAYICAMNQSLSQLKIHRNFAFFPGPNE